MFYDILEQKNGFLGYKNKKSKKSKIEFFPKGLLYAFGQKLVIFANFYFREYTPEKCVLRYSRTKKKVAFKGINTGSSKSRKNEIFQKG